MKILYNSQSATTSTRNSRDKQLTSKSANYKYSGQEYQIILDEISQRDISYVYKNQSKIIKLAQRILKEWESSRQYLSLLQKMLYTFYEKVSIISYARSFLSQLYICFQYISGKIGFDLTQSRRKYRMDVETCQTDLLLAHFIQEQKTIFTRNTPYVVKSTNGPITLKEAIANTKQFYNVYWQQIFSIVQLAIRKQLRQEPSKQQQAYVNNLHLEVAPNISCLGCAQFFFQNRNILNYQSKSQIVIVNKIKELDLTALKVTVDKLKEKGGVILFDCFLQYTDICPTGQIITQEQKKSIQSKIDNHFNALGPAVTVSFVPVKEDPYRFRGVEKVNEAGSLIIERKFIPGQYVVRIQVKSQKDNLHQCKPPLKGQCLASLPTPTPRANDEPDRKEYRYASAMVVNHSHHQTILDRLKKYDVIGKIQIRFQQYKMKGISNVALFYHNIQHEELANIVSYNSDFRFENKYLLIIPILDYIRLSDRNQDNVMSENDMRSLVQWIKKEFPGQQLKLWEFKNNLDEKQFYLEAESKASTLFLYIVMSHLREKSQFKMSRQLQKMSAKQRQSALTLTYSSNDLICSKA